MKKLRTLRKIISVTIFLIGIYTSLKKSGLLEGKFKGFGRKTQ
jgi:hypothetical protein